MIPDTLTHRQTNSTFISIDKHKMLYYLEIDVDEEIRTGANNLDEFFFREHGMIHQL